LSSTTITAEVLNERLRGPKAPLPVDVRSAPELREGQLRGALHLPLHELQERAPELLPDRQAPIVVYCAHGIRSAQALQLLQYLGYEQVSHLEGGFAHWQLRGLPTEVASVTDEANYSAERYSRQVLLAEIGAAGQRRLARARILLIGVGGLGSPAALYLSGAGVGTIGLIDSDSVDLSNLHRQVLHATPRIGIKKVESAQIAMFALNPEVKVELFAERFSAESAGPILDCGWDVIIDGADNFPTRYTLNDFALRRKIPVCHGSIDRFEGRVTTFLGDRGPCYRCLFPRAPRPGTIGSCAERGVLGVLPGVIGTLQATEALKLVLGIGQPLSGRLLTYEALDLRFREMRYNADPNCSACQTRVKGG
jgi:molybdopterin/thiamine biosynthesis adenylyltransferase/rhodanese-related sulfurtransferase